MKIAKRGLFLTAALFVLGAVTLTHERRTGSAVVHAQASPNVVSDGQTFNITQPVSGSAVGPVILMVPSGVVLTDARVTYSSESPQNSGALLIADNNKTYVSHLVNNSTLSAGIDLTSGIVSNGNLRVQFICYFPGNRCQGAIMWSGYQP